MTEDLLTPHRPPTTWWSDRWAWRGALAGAPLGALAAILHALLVLRVGPAEALMAYLVGALVASGIGALLLGGLGASGTAIRHRRCTPVPAVDPAEEPVAEPLADAYADGDDGAATGRHARRELTAA